ncbi:aspartyl/asparaginyl beta-hydroxylase domain-containing protein [Mycolicibacterium vaccae]|nr:aspartyl/asparaginyl beta-hydroxylase domain-containing protein [Mycolicibacterium vaccae]
MSEKRRSIVLGRIAAWAYAMFDRLQALFGRLLSHAPSGRTEFFDPSDFPWIAEVEARADEIQAELDGLLAEVDKLPNFQDIQEEQRHLTQDDRWKVFAFYAYGGRAESNCNRCPRTAEIVESIPGMTTALFSVLLPHKHIPPHTGPWKGVLRYHLALRTPADETLTRIRVGSSTQHWRKGRSMVFDDTFEHEVWNDSEETRVVLFVDFIRELPWYLAIPNRAFIGAIRRSPYIRRALANSEAWQETLGAQVTADTGSTQPGTPDRLAR